MSWKTRAAIAAAAIGCAGAGAIAASAWSEDPSPTADGGDVHQRIVQPAMEIAGPAATGRAPAERMKVKRPKVSHLITSTPITVPATDEIVAELTCKKSQGVPLSGGAIAPPADAQVAIHVLSRFNPNPPYEAKPQTYYVGVRNLASTDAQWHATLTCAKGVSE